MTIRAPLDRLLAQIALMAEDGRLGREAQLSAAEYAAYPEGLACSVKYVIDFYADSEEETAYARDYFVQIILVAYREAKKQNPEIASAFAASFVIDFPGTTGTALLPRWVSLGEASIALKAALPTKSCVAVWQGSSRMVLQINEFLDGLIGLLLITWRCGLGRNFSPKVLGNDYGSKTQEFRELTRGDDGVFYLLLRLARPDLRNGLAHGSAWLDYEAGVVRYTVGRHGKTEHELDIVEFMACTKLGADLAQAYIAALNVVLLFESGSPDAVSLLPSHLARLWNSWGLPNKGIERTVAS